MGLDASLTIHGDPDIVITTDDAYERVLRHATAPAGPTSGLGYPRT